MDYGKKVWIFPDAELPPAGSNIILGHESIIITNCSSKMATITITLLYTDKDPIEIPNIYVNAKRVRCIRTNEEKDFGKYTAVIGVQYALLLVSNVPVVAQYGRAEPRNVNFYTTPGYCE